MSSERNKLNGKTPIQAEAKLKLRIEICEASVVSIHKLAMSPRVFIRTHKKYFVMRATPELHFALGIHVNNALKIVVHLPSCSTPKKSVQKGTLKESFQGSFSGSKCYLKRDQKN